jgi:hypothetical protein
MNVLEPGSKTFIHLHSQMYQAARLPVWMVVTVLKTCRISVSAVWMKLK